MSKRIPSYRHHKPSGQGVVTIRGRDYYLGIWKSAESREKYDRLIAEFLADGTVAPGPKILRTLTIAELAERYLEYARSYYRSVSQIDRVERSIDAVLNLYASLTAAEFGPIGLKAVRQGLIDTGRLNRATVNKRIDCLRLMFRWGVEEQLLPAAVAESLYMVRRIRKQRIEGLAEPKKVQPAPPDHVQAILPHVMSSVRAMIQLQLLTGMRPGEVVGLSSGELNRCGQVQISDVETLHLDGCWVYEPLAHKMEHHDSRRIVIFGPRAQEVLAPYLDRLPGVPFFSPAEASLERSQRRRAARTTPVYASTDRYFAERRTTQRQRPPADRYKTGSYRRAIWYGCKQAGVPPWHPHQLRHNATDFLVEQFGWEVARIVLGHKSIDTTQIYARDDLKKAADAMRKAG